MTGIRRLVSLPVAAVAILSLLVSALTFTPPLKILEAQGENPPPARPTGLTVAVSGQSVTLSWDDTGVSGISYQYRVNHNDTGTGKLKGWGSWQDITGPSTTGSRFSYTISGHTLGKEYRYKIRAVNIGGGSKPAPAASPWYVAATPIDPKPPALSDLWTVRVCDDLFKVRWNFVPGATGYDMEMSGNGRQSWQRKMTNKNKNGWQFSKWTKNATFWFRVRAVNAHGVSEWSYVKSIAPPCQVEGLQANRIPIDGQSGTISVSWDAAHRASGYDVDFTADNGKSWQRMVTDLRATSYEFTKHIPYNPNYRVSVQSRRKGVTSGWTTVPIAGLIAANVGGTTAMLNFNGYSGNWYYKANEPPDDALCNGPVSGAMKDLTGLHAGTDYQYTAYSDSSCTDTISSVTFSTPVTLTVSNVTATAATLTLAGHDLQWWYDADTGPHTTCQGPVAAGTSTADLSGLTANQQHTYKAYNAAGCNDGDRLASVTFTPEGVVLTATSVEATTAVLELAYHAGNWWLKQTGPTEGTCTAGDASFSHALSDLIPGTEYTYKAYDVNTCADTGEIDDAAFTTGGVSVRNLSLSGTGSCLIGAFQGRTYQCANAFGTGSATNGYTLHSVTAEFLSGTGTVTGFTVALHTMKQNGIPSDSTVPNATLSSNDGDPSASADSTRTYTCTGTGCQLLKDTDYFIAMTATNTSGDHYHRWRKVNGNAETKVPFNNGWSIADGLRLDSNWQNLSTSSGVFKVAATVNP